MVFFSFYTGNPASLRRVEFFGGAFCYFMQAILQVCAELGVFGCFSLFMQVVMQGWTRVVATVDGLMPLFGRHMLAVYTISDLAR